MSLTVSPEGDMSLTVSPEGDMSLTVSPEGDMSLTVSPEGDMSLTVSPEGADVADGFTRGRRPEPGRLRSSATYTGVKAAQKAAPSTLSGLYPVALVVCFLRCRWLPRAVAVRSPQLQLWRSSWSGMTRPGYFFREFGRSFFGASMSLKCYVMFFSIK